MRKRTVIAIVTCLLCLTGALWLWQSHKFLAERNARHLAYVAAHRGLPANPSSAKNLPARAKSAMATNRFAFRLSNTSKSIGQLLNDPHAILLENALIDTAKPLTLSIPAHLRAKGDAGSYIVQARGPITAAFRATLAQSDAQIISYIPNNAYLVKISADVATALAKQPPVQAVIPYEPYYKIKSSLLSAAVAQEQLPDSAILNFGLYAAGAQQTISQIEKLGGIILGQGTSPFGPVVQVQPPQNWTALALLPGVQIVEPFHRPVLANDLSREELGVAVDSVTQSNYLGLTGQNVIVEVNDSGIDTNHPDLQGRVYFNDPANGVDTDGHGTHVAGIIAGSGAESETVTNAFGSIITNGTSPNLTASPFQFRGMAPSAQLFSMNLGDDDVDKQQAAALTNALISNNSWTFPGDNSYDLEAASYDAATRDALPFVTGSQPVLFVFAAGNSGNGDDTSDPGGGDQGSISSPGTAKNVITVGSVQELRNIVVTPPVTNADGSTGQPWQAETSTGYRVAGFSSRGNVGVGTEGQFGRFKPDVVAPGTFVISTRSSEWDITDYFYQDPTNNDKQTYSGIIVQPDSLWVNGFPIVPNNAIGVSINVFANDDSPTPFPSLPIYVGLIGSPSSLFGTNSVNIPPDGGATFLNQIENTETFYGFNYGISNASSEPISFDLQTDVITTNAVGDIELALSNLDNSIGTFNPGSTGPGPYYRYESGTSMSAADISGTLALMQDFFINRSALTGDSLTNPSPALLKAMLINGARLTSTSAYSLQVNNPDRNYEGWGMANLPNSLPPAIQTNFDGTVPTSIFIQDQSPTNALATGESQTFFITVSTNASAQDMRVTLAWTDPPGDPAAAIKLVNNLDLVVSNMDTGDTFFGNDISAGGIYNNVWSTNEITNAVGVADSINNVEEVLLPPGLSQHYAVTVIGRDVNVNAVTAQTNNSAGNFAPNTVQDFALVATCGGGAVPGAFTVTNGGIATVFSNDVTYVTSTNSAFVNQFVGASSPLIGTNQVGVGANGQWNPDGAITLGETNQWHFYVVTNNAVDASGNTGDVTNAAFITFLPPTLSVPRMGVFEDSVANATRPEADIDLYVTTDPTLTNLNPVAISNCVNGAQVGASAAGVFNGVSLGRGGSEFVADTNSSPNEVYYVGVKSEDQMAAEYDFLSAFTSTPFSQNNTNGDELVNGIALPVNIPDGSPTQPGITNILMLALTPIDIGDVVVTVTNTHENFGDLIGTLTFGTEDVVLNNHDALGSIVDQGFIYDDGSGSGTNGIPFAGSQPSDGPGSLQSFLGNNGLGVWRLAEVDDSPGQTGSVQNVSILLKKHQSLGGKGITVTILPQQWFYDFIDVPAGVTNLTINGTNITVSVNPLGPDPANPLEMVEELGEEPTLTNADKGPVFLTNGIANGAGGNGLGNSISVGPTDVPPIQPGRYWVGIYNPSLSPQTASVNSVLTFQGSGNTIDFDSGGSTAILDDAVTASSVIDVTTNLPVASLNVGIVVQHPRISDLVFHLISPDGTRVLLMENRGGDDPNGAGAEIIITNLANFAANGTTNASTNFVVVGESTGTLPISWNFFTVPDEMTVYDTTNVNDFGPGDLLFDTGMTNGTGQTNLPFTTADGALTIIMNQFGNTNGAGGDAWTYTAGGTQTNFYYLMFTEDTNLTDTPIKFAVPPFVPDTNTVVLSTNSFEGLSAADYTNGQTVAGWKVTTNQVSLVTDTNNAYNGSNFVALASGVISNTLPTIAGNTYTLTFAYRGPGIAGWWRAENNTNDSSGNGNNPSAVTGITFTNGEVGKAFHYDGSSSLITAPASSSLMVSNLTLESWVFPTDASHRPIIDYGGSGQSVPISLWINTEGGSSTVAGAIYALIRDGSNINNYIQVTVGGIVTMNQWNHLVFTYNDTSRIGTLYCNGVAVQSGVATGTLFPASAPVNLGYRNSGSADILAGTRFLGNLDEVSIYNRALSDSEIKAIYAKGAAGKFDPVVFNTSPAESLSEAQISVNGQTSTILGNDTTWQTKTITFTATQNGTPIEISGIEPGMLLDDFVLTQVPGNLYYLPEQSLDAFDGENAGGDWTLEIQDDRAGAALTNSLLGWELQFVFADTNAVASSVSGGIGESNQFIPANDIAWYQINVPANATIATNILLFATNSLGVLSPLNVWFSTNVPPTITNPAGGDDDLIPDSTGNTTSPAILYTNSSPVFIVPGGTYYLGVQNTNSFTVNYGIKVNFNVAGQFSSAPVVSSVSVSGGGTTLKWTASPSAQFEIQWTDDLTQPWNTDTNIITSGDGNFTFTDDGSQTAPLGAQRFYRLVQISP